MPSSPCGLYNSPRAEYEDLFSGAYSSLLEFFSQNKDNTPRLAEFVFKCYSPSKCAQLRMLCPCCVFLSNASCPPCGGALGAGQGAPL